MRRLYGGIEVVYTGHGDERWKEERTEKKGKEEENGGIAGGGGVRRN